MAGLDRLERTAAAGGGNTDRNKNRRVDMDSNGKGVYRVSTKE
ncbi:hypothetical protein GBAR_LOCUS12384 [Geodia barretti]|uniref:Uncharacterized protein n=1 Tax=Geodia barretti TaxID=519541 RepID=A0AA35WNC5_GEOBA|nr:hypothetical protein GBAR_LOCUS12384 [Geodia barretti]